MAEIGRRRFLRASLLAPLVRAAPGPPRRLAFSTLGCPKWRWEQVLDTAGRSGYGAIELRGIEGEMDLTKRAEFVPGRLAATLADLRALDLEVSDLGASARLHELDPARRRAQLDDARRFIDLAHRMKVRYVRVFPDKFVPGEAKRATRERISAGLRELGEYGRPAGVTVLLESHGDFTDSDSLLEILRSAEPSGAGLLWDAHHTVVAGREAPASTWARLGQFVRHVHLKDSRPDGKGGHQYVLTGSGTVPVRATVATLVRGGYGGYYSFEWEKAWHPEIEEPETAIPHFARVVGGYLAEFGVR